MEILKNIDQKKVLDLKNLVSYSEGQVVSRTLIQNDGLGITLFAFASGEGISAHKSEGDALVIVLDGTGEVTIDDEKFTIKSGESIVMPAQHPHAIFAPENFKMLLIVAF